MTAIKEFGKFWLQRTAAFPGLTMFALLCIAVSVVLIGGLAMFSLAMWIEYPWFSLFLFLLAVLSCADAVFHYEMSKPKADTEMKIKEAFGLLLKLGEYMEDVGFSGQVMAENDTHEIFIRKKKQPDEGK